MNFSPKIENQRLKRESGYSSLLKHPDYNPFQIPATRSPFVALKTTQGDHYFSGEK